MPQTLKKTLHTEIWKPKNLKKYPSKFPGTKVQMAGSEPLIQEADPHITKLAIEAQMKDKDGPKI